MKTLYEVIDLQGKVLMTFDSEEKAHQYADEYGDQTGLFAYVEQVQS